MDCTNSLILLRIIALHDLSLDFKFFNISKLIDLIRIVLSTDSELPNMSNIK